MNTSHFEPVIRKRAEREDVIVLTPEVKERHVKCFVGCSIASFFTILALQIIALAFTISLWKQLQ